jgi:hypothetical protein
MVTWPHVLWENIMVVRACGRGELFISWQIEAESSNREGPRPNIMAPVTYLLQQGNQFYFLSITYSDFESIN